MLTLLYTDGYHIHLICQANNDIVAVWNQLLFSVYHIQYIEYAGCCQVTLVTVVHTSGKSRIDYCNSVMWHVRL